ncbi:MAG: glycosyltransferase family A protein [Pseudomonadota bacterium]
MSKHDFLVVVPVADRPRHIQACLTSLRNALQRFPYAGRIRVLIADDSADVASIATNRAIARQFSADGLEVIHFPPEEQIALVRSLGIVLPRVLGDAPPDHFGHKGQGVMRNIAYLKVAEMLRLQPDNKTLIWSIDSDQEFRVNVTEDDGYVVDFFNGLDAIFARSDAQVLTGKVVGDPPVSPAVMTRNFLDDVLAFLAQMAERDPATACGHHDAEAASGDAAYHDMADLFGFKPADSYAYPCPLIDAHGGTHTEADCFANFAGRVNSFFYGEHPTRISGYVAGELFASVQPARTVYAGNYVFRPEVLRYFIPFATLRLRMSGPTLGRIVKAELGPRFVSANLPMLHKRTVESGGQSEFRPGIDTQHATIDMSGEFERQFYGDVMLFSVEKLTAAGNLCRLVSADFSQTLDETRGEMLARYNARQQAILERLEKLEGLLDNPTYWWHGHAAGFRQFATNVRRNFGTASSGHARINDAANWTLWRGRLLDALTHYAEDRAAWSQLI